MAKAPDGSLVGERKPLGRMTADFCSISLHPVSQLNCNGWKVCFGIKCSFTIIRYGHWVVVLRRPDVKGEEMFSLPILYRMCFELYVNVAWLELKSQCEAISISKAWKLIMRVFIVAIRIEWKNIYDCQQLQTSAKFRIVAPLLYLICKR